MSNRFSLKLRPDIARSAVVSFLFGSVMLVGSSHAEAFCGFFVAAADASLFNSASRVVIVHDEGKTVLTMVNDYRGEPRSFALVVPVPIVLQKELVRVTDMKVVDHLDAFSAPRLAEYFDPNPCAEQQRRKMLAPSAAERSEAASGAVMDRAPRLGVTVEATYTVGEYDIVILSATQSDGLETWLRQENYNIPRGAAAALAPYVRSGLKFFVAKVNLKEQAKTGFQMLRPLQFAYPDKRFMLPVRLGMLNADGDQDLLAYVITKQHRAEVANYRTVKLPTDLDVPTFVKNDFKPFYRDMFTNQVRKHSGRAVFTEYAWNMSWCDPCAADPLSADSLRKLGVWWLPENARGGSGGVGGPQNAFVTRLHARYNANTFPEDLMLKVTQDSSNFQARYVLRHPWGGTESCAAMRPYLKNVEARREKEVNTLAQLTGWSTQDIWPKMVPLPGVRERGGARDRPNEPHKPQPEDPKDRSWLEGMKDFFKSN